MKIEAVKMMRNIRDQMSQDIKGMTWAEEQEYLRSHAKKLEFLVNDVSDKSNRLRSAATDDAIDP